MQNRLAHRMRCLSPLVRLALTTFTLFAIVVLVSSFAMAQASPSSQTSGSATPTAPAVERATVPAHEAGGEANLQLPDLSSQNFIGGAIDGHKLLLFGLIICVLGLLFGLVIFVQLKNMPVHRTMREVSELIYETCKTYLITQGKFIALLWIFIAVVIGLYFGKLAPTPGHPVAQTVLIILAFSVIGILGSYGVAWFGIRVNTFANSRTAFAGLRGKPYPIYAIPLKAGMRIGMLIISV
jgi:K(+)-stimulated pyrophosphate-energized sodium pump